MLKDCISLQKVKEEEDYDDESCSDDSLDLGLDKFTVKTSLNHLEHKHRSKEDSDASMEEDESTHEDQK